MLELDSDLSLKLTIYDKNKKLIKSVKSLKKLQYNKWKHVAFVYNKSITNSTEKIYIDAVDTTTNNEKAPEIFKSDKINVFQCKLI